MTIQRLFVYGTLAPGQANHNVLEGVAGSWEAATLRGVLLQEGWGAAMGFPGIIPKEDGDKVEGLVFSSEDLENHWARLDEFEGEGYERIAVSVSLKKGNKVEAYVYALK